MKIEIIKSIKITEAGNTVLPLKHICEVDDQAGEVYVSKGYAKEVKSSGDRPNQDDTIKLVIATTTLEELKPFEANERKKVKAAVEAHKVKLIEVND